MNEEKVKDRLNLEKNMNMKHRRKKKNSTNKMIWKIISTNMEKKEFGTKESWAFVAHFRKNRLTRECDC